MITLNSPLTLQSVQRNLTKTASHFNPLQFGDKTGFEEESPPAPKNSLSQSGPPTFKMPKWVYGLLLVGGGFLGLGFCNNKQAEVSLETSAPLVQVSQSLPPAIQQNQIQDTTTEVASKPVKENQPQNIIIPSPVSFRPTHPESGINKPEKTPREPGARNLSH